VPKTDSLDRFLLLQARVQNRRASSEERVEWRGLVRTLLEGEVKARSKQNPGEGRKHVRTNARVPARVRGRKGGAITVDVSLGTGGLTLHADLPYERGEVLEVTIPLPEAEDYVRALARVAWRRGGNTGLELVELSRADQDLLESAVVEAMLRPR
jgi:hypothetical protein